MQENQLTDDELKEGWQLLFDGRTLDGWRTFQYKQNKTWSIKDSSIYCGNHEKEEGDVRVDLISRFQYDNFILSLNWKLSPSGNSGIMYHVTEYHDRTFYSGPEYQLLDDKAFEPELAAWHKTGSNYEMHAARVVPTRPIGEFNHTVIVVNGLHREHWLNGEKVVAYESRSNDWYTLKGNGKWANVIGYDMARVGHLTLQDHGSEVWFKNIKIKKLPLI